MQLDGKTILITGAGSGIGRALAFEAAARGASLLLAGRREAALHDTAAALPPGTRAAAVAVGDITEQDGRAALVRSIAEHFDGRLDILVNNAGTLTTGPLAALDDAALMAMVQTNLVAPAALIRDCLPLLRHTGGRVVNVGSMFGDIAYPLFAFYSATKFGLRGLSDALRRELAPDGIGVTYVAPRATRTDAVSAFEQLIEPFGMKLDPADRVARRIWDGVERKAKTVYPSGLEPLFVLVQRLLPGVIDGGIARQLTRAGGAAAGDRSLASGM
jgi:short-subunit dehydrogenase